MEVHLQVLCDVLPIHHQFGKVIVLQDVLDFAKKSILNMKKKTKHHQSDTKAAVAVGGHRFMEPMRDQKQTPHPTVGSVHILHIFHIKVLKKITNSAFCV